MALCEAVFTEGMKKLERKSEYIVKILKVLPQTAEYADLNINI